jgi:hypothetical protein
MDRSPRNRRSRRFCRFAGPAADVAALVGHRAELLEEEARHVLEETHRARGTVVEDRCRPGLAPDREQALGDNVERLIPGNGNQRAVLPQQRTRQPLGGVLQLEVLTRAATQEALCDRVPLVPLQLDDAPVLDRRDDAANVGAVAIAQRLFHHAHVISHSVRDASLGAPARWDREPTTHQS